MSRGLKNHLRKFITVDDDELEEIAAYLRLMARRGASRLQGRVLHSIELLFKLPVLFTCYERNTRSLCEIIPATG